MLKIRRALVSVWDKKGLVDFSKGLANLKVEIISTGKTASLLKRSGAPVKKVFSVTSFPEILSGRVKTLHPKIFGGILANKKHPLHMEEINGLGIQPIDMVVVNFYPFQEKVRDSLSFDEMIEYIDVGGPAMARAAAKNFKNVACITSPRQYKAVLDELQKNNGFISEDTLKRLAAEVFYMTKEYDKSIYNYFKGGQIVSWDLEKVSSLRYGENPHQKANLYRAVTEGGVKFRQIQGKELSFNNFLDLDTALCCVREFNEPASVIVKHASICGVGVGKNLSTAYSKSFETDPLSSFGGIIGLNRKVDRETASQIMKTGFKECIIAPGYSKEALKIFSAKKNLRILDIDNFDRVNVKDVKATDFGYLIQDKDAVMLDKSSLKVVTKRKPTPREMKDLLLAWKVVKYARSNAIVVVKNQWVLGVGAGEPSRVGAVKIALSRTIKSCRGGVLASDGFFPKEDAIKNAHKKGIKAIIQPGGSIKDEDIIKLCDKLGISMLCTGMRHFRH